MTLSSATTISSRPYETDSSLPAIRELLRRHAAGILVAVLLALVLVLPRWWIVATDPDVGVRAPISPYGAGTIGYDESLYSASIREAYDGAVPISDPYLINHRDDAPQRSAFPHEAIGVLGRMVGGTFHAMAITTTVAALAALLMLYVLLYRITGSKWVAAGMLPAVLFAVEIINHAEGLLPLRHREILAPVIKADPLREFHAWSRYPAPILVLAPFFAGALAFPTAVGNGDRRWMALSALAFAALIYTYAYYWTAFGLALALWLAALVLMRAYDEAKRLIIIASAATLLALPEVVVLAQSIGSLPDDVRSRIGLEEPGIDLSLAVTMGQRILIGLPFAAAALAARPRQVLYVALFASPLILGSLTGILPQPWHFHTQVWTVFAIPVVASGTAVVVRHVRDSHTSTLAGWAFGIAAVACCLYVVTLQTRAVLRTDDAFALSEAEDAAIAWIRDNVDDGETVVSPSITTNMMLAAMTRASSYLGEGGFSTATNDELMERVLRAQAAYGYSEEDAFGRLNVINEFQGFPVNDARGSAADQERELEDYLAFFTFSFEISDGAAFMDHIESWRPRYRTLLQSESTLSGYPAEYLYCGHRERFFENAQPAGGTWVLNVYAVGDYAIYEIVDPRTVGAFEFDGCS